MMEECDRLIEFYYTFFVNIRNFKIAQKFFNKLTKIAPSSPQKNCLLIAD